MAGNKRNNVGASGTTQHPEPLDVIEELIRIAGNADLPANKAVALQRAASLVYAEVAPANLNRVNKIVSATSEARLNDAERAKVFIALVHQMEGLPDEGERKDFFVQMFVAATESMAEEPRAPLLEALAKAIGKLHPRYRARAFHLVKNAAENLPPLLRSSVLEHLAERLPDLPWENEKTYALVSLIHSAKDMQGMPQASLLSKITGVIPHFANGERLNAIDMLFDATHSLRSPWNKVIVLSALTTQIPLFANEQERITIFDKTLTAAQGLSAEHRIGLLIILSDLITHLPAGGRRFKAAVNILRAGPEDPLFRLSMETKVELLKIAKDSIPELPSNQYQASLIVQALERRVQERL